MVISILCQTLNRADTSQAGLLSDGTELPDRVQVRQAKRSDRMGIPYEWYKCPGYRKGLKEDPNKDQLHVSVAYYSQAQGKDVRHVHGTEESLS